MTLLGAIDAGEVAKSLWDAANAVTGFAALQTFAFIYACAQKEFSGKIARPTAKRFIAVAIWVSVLAYCGAVAWSADRGSDLAGEKAYTRLCREAAFGRIVFLVGLGIVSTLALYARELLGSAPTATQLSEGTRGPD